MSEFDLMVKRFWLLARTPTWTPALKAALRQLLEQADAAVLDDFVGTWLTADPWPKTVEAQVELLCRSYAPEELADAWQTSIDWAAAIAMPSLSQILDGHDRWDDHTRLWAEYWLVTRASDAQLAAIRDRLGKLGSTRQTGPRLNRDQLINLLLSLPLPALRTAWLGETAPPPTTSQPSRSAAIRQWALQSGTRVGERGRLSSAVIQRYEREVGNGIERSAEEARNG